MAFITGIDLGGQITEDRYEDEEVSTRPAPFREALEAVEGPKQVDYSQLLNDVSTIDTGDPLEELRRMIRRTRSKMDRQTKVLDSFVTDVRQIKCTERSFSSGDLLDQGDWAPAGNSEPQRASASTGHHKGYGIRMSSSPHPAESSTTSSSRSLPLAQASGGGGSGSGSSGAGARLATQLSAAQRRGLPGPGGSLDGREVSLRGSSSLGSTASQSDGFSSLRAAAAGSSSGRGLQGSRSMPGGLGSGRATPGLPESLRAELQTLKVPPARRAPPGAPGRTEQEARSSGAFASRARASAAGVSTSGSDGGTKRAPRANRYL